MYFQPLTRALASNETISTVTLGLNDIADQGAGYVAELLTKNRVISTLVLNGALRVVTLVNVCNGHEFSAR